MPNFQLALKYNPKHKLYFPEIIERRTSTEILIQVENFLKNQP